MLINASRMAESVNACSLKQLQQKLAALTAVNSALTVENEDLRAQLEALDEEGTTADVTELQEEFEKRLGAAQSRAPTDSPIPFRRLTRLQAVHGLHQVQVS
jgi:regulator of replication initiation timing